MSDILPDLRALSANGRTSLVRSIALDAFDEITRLRAEVEHWKEARTSALEGGHEFKAENERLRGEVERLTEDLATAERAIDAQTHWRSELADRDEQIEALQSKVHLTAAYDRMEAERDAAREAFRWIPVSERLPEYGVKVVAICSDFRVRGHDGIVFAAREKWLGGDWRPDGTNGGPWTVTHWMHLPEPPK